MSWGLLAVISCVALLGWLVLTEWVSMPPLNDLRASPPAVRLRAAAVNYAVLLVIAGGVITSGTVGATIATVVASVWLLGHVMSWWLPYFGVSFQSQRDAYQREYSRTLKILPTDGHDVVVDAQHIVVGLLTLPMFVFVTLHAVDVMP